MKRVWFQSNKQLFFTPYFLHCLPLIRSLLPHWKRGLHCFQVKELGWSCKSCCSQASDYSPNEWFTHPSHQPLLLSDWFRWHSCGPSGGHEFRFITCRRLQGRASQYVTGNLLLISLLLLSVYVPKLYGGKPSVSKGDMIGIIMSVLFLGRHYFFVPRDIPDYNLYEVIFYSDWGFSWFSLAPSDECRESSHFCIRSRNFLSSQLLVSGLH
jgi:hypothetical protein